MNPPQLDIAWDTPEPFQLIVQSAPDGDRIQREQAQLEADKQHAEKQQPTLI